MLFPPQVEVAHPIRTSKPAKQRGHSYLFPASLWQLDTVMVFLCRRLPNAHDGFTFPLATKTRRMPIGSFSAVNKQSKLPQEML